MLRKLYIAQNVQWIIDNEFDGNKSAFDKRVGKNMADRLVNARGNPRHSTLQMLSEKFGKPVTWFESDNSTDAKGGDAVTNGRDKEILELMKQLRELTEELGECRVALTKAEAQLEIRELKAQIPAPEKGRSLKVGRG